MATAAQRQHVAAVLTMLQAHAGQLDYPPGDQRTSRDAISWGLSEQQCEHVLKAGGRVQWDCSEFCPWVLKCAGLWHLSQPGATGSHLGLLPHYDDPRDAFIGALVVFGPGSGHHEAIVWKPDAKNGNPILASHGHAGFDRITLHDLAARQAASGYPGVTLLSIAHL